MCAFIRPNLGEHFAVSIYLPAARLTGVVYIDGKMDSCGLLQRAHIVAGEIRYIGKESDRKWEEART